MALPLKTRILKFVMDANRPVTVSNIMDELENEYHGERQFTRKRVEAYLDSFLGVQFMKAEKVALDKDGQLVVYCMVTDYGRNRGRFIPGYKKLMI